MSTVLMRAVLMRAVLMGAPGMGSHAIHVQNTTHGADRTAASVRLEEVTR
jgi:hypothetical protein